MSTLGVVTAPVSKEMLYKDSYAGNAKVSGKAFAFIELHDPESLENTKFFLQPGQTIDTKSFQIKDKVKADFTISFANGKPSLILSSLVSAKF